MTIDELDYQEE